MPLPAGPSRLAAANAGRRRGSGRFARGDPRADVRRTVGREPASRSPATSLGFRAGSNRERVLIGLRWRAPSRLAPGVTAECLPYLPRVTGGGKSLAAGTNATAESVRLAFCCGSVGSPRRSSSGFAGARFARTAPRISGRRAIRRVPGIDPSLPRAPRSVERYRSDARLPRPRSAACCHCPPVPESQSPNGF